MNHTTGQILFLGPTAHGERVQSAAPTRLRVYLPGDWREALAIFTVYMPPLVVASTAAGGATPATAHLREVGARILIAPEDEAPATTVARALRALATPVATMVAPHG